MSGLKPYLVTIYGITHAVLLSDEDAKKRGLTEPTTATGKADADVQNKMRTAEHARRARKPLPRDENGEIVRDKTESAGQ